ncbi:hypothetical protein C8T65DRAFT_3460 [Cerioporus squamosus]|nr:hypothetical protein C8T65DRAFT_3460 [Cerioporus squamosus]
MSIPFLGRRLPLLLSPTVSHMPLSHALSADHMHRSAPAVCDRIHANYMPAHSHPHALPCAVRPPRHPRDLFSSSDLRRVVIVTSYTSAL